MNQQTYELQHPLHQQVEMAWTPPQLLNQIPLSHWETGTMSH